MINVEPGDSSNSLDLKSQKSRVTVSQETPMRKSGCGWVVEAVLRDSNSMRSSLLWIRVLRTLGASHELISRMHPAHKSLLIGNAQQ